MLQGVGPLRVKEITLQATAGNISNRKTRRSSFHN